MAGSKFEPAEVPRVLCDDYEIVVNAATQDAVVGFAKGTNVPRVADDVLALGIEGEGYLGGNALVEE